MSENKDKGVYVNNSDDMFLNGGLYGMKFCIEMTQEERLNCDKGNGLATLLNETLDSLWQKMFQVFRLTLEHKRVANFDEMIKAWKSDNKNIESKKKLEELIEKMWGTLNNENK